MFESPRPAAPARKITKRESIVSIKLLRIELHVAGVEFLFKGFQLNRSQHTSTRLVGDAQEKTVKEDVPIVRVVFRVVSHVHVEGDILGVRWNRDQRTEEPVGSGAAGGIIDLEGGVVGRVTEAERGIARRPG